MYALIRPLLFRMDAEQAHYWVLKNLKRLNAWGLMPVVRPDVCPTRLMGLDLPNPVGLAAGLDKNGEYIRELANLGFGFIEVGTVTPLPQTGNPRPRLFRVPEHEAIINRMGFNNLGIDQLIENVRLADYRGVLGINIGKNASTPIERAVDDYLIGLEKAYLHASYITVNVSSPNTKNLRSLQGGDELSRLLSALKDKQQQLSAIHQKYTPLAVKIAPDLDEQQIQDVAHVLVQTEIDGVIATNTTLDKTGLNQHPLAQETGGLSGAPLLTQANVVLQQLVSALGGKVPVIGVGGILNGAHAREKMRLGATAIQLYSGLVYRGADLIKECLVQLK